MKVNNSLPGASRKGSRTPFGGAGGPSAAPPIQAFPGFGDRISPEGSPFQIYVSEQEKIPRNSGRGIGGPGLVEHERASRPFQKWALI
jgi:hypothetical protein